MKPYIEGYRQHQMQMRSEQEMLSLILSVAEKTKQVRAVLLSGSRTNPNIIQDVYQDYDVVYLVDDVTAFRDQPNWIDVFGERLIMQMPNSMVPEDTEDIPIENGITYLMLFTDTNRIDLNLIPLHHKASSVDSLTKVLLDKDNIFPKKMEPGDQDYRIKKPTPKQFSDCCNEFWWVSTYVIKGLVRNEIPYAKDMLENPVRRMFMLMLSWQVGTQTHFSVNPGKCYKFLEKHVPPALWHRILKTYPDADRRNIWKSLQEMAVLFHQTGIQLGHELGFPYNLEEAENVKGYLNKLGSIIEKEIAGATT